MAAIWLVSGRRWAHRLPMALPLKPVALTSEQLTELSRKLSTLRHDINNHLLLIMASSEMIQLRPETSAQMLKNLVDQPPKISEAIKKFSADFEQTMGIRRP
jgi:hypothetical protein